MTTTVKNLIAQLQALANQYGDDVPVYIYDEWTANEGYGFTAGDLYVPAEADMYEPDDAEVKDGAPSRCILIQ